MRAKRSIYKTEEERKDGHAKAMNRYYKKNKKEIAAKYKDWLSKNREKANGYAKEWRKRNPEKHKLALQKQHLRRKYNMTIDEYCVLFENQNGACSICENPQSNFKKSLFVDHDHNTGKVRGLLCHNCNVVLGHSFDDVFILEKSINYLKKYSHEKN